MKKRLYCSPEKKLCGVCGGIADYFNIDPSLVRLIAVEIALFTAIVPALITYFIVALIIPQPTPEYEQMFRNTSKRLYKSNDKKIAGVCGGIADYFDIDPTIVRLLFFLLVLLVGNGIVTYIACAVILPRAPETATAQDYAAYSQPYTPPQDAQFQPQDAPFQPQEAPENQQPAEGAAPQPDEQQQ